MAVAGVAAVAALLLATVSTAAAESVSLWLHQAVPKGMSLEDLRHQDAVRHQETKRRLLGASPVADIPVESFTKMPNPFSPPSIVDPASLCPGKLQRGYRRDECCSRTITISGTGPELQLLQSRIQFDQICFRCCRAARWIIRFKRLGSIIGYMSLMNVDYALQWQNAQVHSETPQIQAY